jgi:hypothetical protein
MPPGPPLELRVPNTATVGQVVEEYVKVRRNASTTLNTSTSSIGLPGREAYSLLIAEVLVALASSAPSSPPPCCLALTAVTLMCAG